MLGEKSLSQRWALPVLMLGAVTIAVSPVLVRLSEVGPTATGFWRLALAIPLILLVRSRQKNVVPLGLLRTRGLLIAGLLFALDIFFWHWSLNVTTIANATLLANLNPVFVALGAFFIFDQRLSKLFLAGLATAIIGSILLSLQSYTIDPGRLYGDALAVVAAIFYGGYYLAIGRLRDHFGTYDIMLVVALTTALALVPLALVMGDGFLPATLYGWAVLLGLAGLVQVAGHGAIIFAFRFLPATFGVLVLLIQPIIAAIIAWPLFGERLNVLDIVAALVILAGIVLARMGSRD